MRKLFSNIKKNMAHPYLFVLIHRSLIFFNVKSLVRIFQSLDFFRKFQTSGSDHYTPSHVPNFLNAKNQTK